MKQDYSGPQRRREGLPGGKTIESGKGVACGNTPRGKDRGRKNNKPEDGGSCLGESAPLLLRENT